MEKPVRICPRCKKQSAEYALNDIGNWVFKECVCCGFTAKEYEEQMNGKPTD